MAEKNKQAEPKHKLKYNPQFIVGDVTMTYDKKGRFTIPDEMSPEQVYYFRYEQEGSLSVYPESRFAEIAAEMNSKEVFDKTRREFFVSTDVARKDGLNRVLTPRRMRNALGFKDGEKGLVKLMGNSNHIIVARADKD